MRSKLPANGPLGDNIQHLFGERGALQIKRLVIFSRINQLLQVRWGLGDRVQLPAQSALWKSESCESVSEKGNTASSMTVTTALK